MTTLKIGTVLIAKKDVFMDITNVQCLTKDKPYKVNKLTEIYCIIESDIDEDHCWAISELDSHFIIAQPTTEVKRYTLTDLKDKKIAVKLRSKEEYIKMCKLCGDDDLSGYSEENDYCGFDVKGQFAYLYIDELENRTLLESIDEIDLEEKEEEHKPINKVAELIGEASMCWSETPKGIFDSTRASKIVDEIEAVYNSEIIRIKEENKELKDHVTNLKNANGAFAEKILKQKEEIQQLENWQPTTDQSERTRMAWELYVSGFNHGIADKWTIDECFRSAEIFLNHENSFLAKSKEVKP